MMKLKQEIKELKYHFDLSIQGCVSQFRCTLTSYEGF